MLDGMMAFGKLETGQRTLDFECCEDVVAEPFVADFHVQGMRDGNVYMTERPKRRKNKPIFRDDNCSLSHGHNGKYYFDVEYYSSDLKEGYYVVVMASDHSFKKPYAVAYAELK